jgi:hypothetical protein
MCVRVGVDTNTYTHAHTHTGAALLPRICHGDSELDCSRLQRQDFSGSGFRVQGLGSALLPFLCHSDPELECARLQR